MSRRLRPLRVWSYRNWSWICRLHPGNHGPIGASGWDLQSWDAAMKAAAQHWREHHR